MDPESRSTARSLARLTGTLHNLVYYAPEMKAFGDLGLREYWRAYVAYRSAPMGEVSAGTAGAVFYNFAPGVMAAALPSAWDATTPHEVLELRSRCIDGALRRALGLPLDSDTLVEAAALARAGIDDTDASGRMLFAAHTELAWPSEPHLALWHACTLWREHRGDGHNIALAAAGIDGLECHLLLAAKGVASQRIIEKIRGWSPDEWEVAKQRLIVRGLLEGDGSYTSEGEALRNRIEAHTDELSAEPRDRLGSARSQRLIELLNPIVADLIETGAVAGRWPPPEDPGNTT